MNLLINDVLVKDVTSFNCNECEISIYFDTNHTYSLNEFITMFEQMNSSLGRFYYNGQEDYNIFRAIQNNTTEEIAGKGETSCLIVAHQYSIQKV